MEKSEAILIRKTPLTDTSLIVHWCTKDHGIIQTAARGARRPGSPFAGKLDLFYAAEIEWTRAKRGDLHTLRESAVSDFRHGLQDSWLRVLCASYFVRLIEIVTEQEAPAETLYLLLERALGYLSRKDPDRKAVLFFERELATDLGIHGEEGVTPIAAIARLFQRIPEQRESLFRRLG